MTENKHCRRHGFQYFRDGKCPFCAEREKALAVVDSAMNLIDRLAKHALEQSNSEALGLAMNYGLEVTRLQGAIGELVALWEREADD